MARSGSAVIDTCGYGTEWGCGGEINGDAHVLLDAHEPFLTGGNKPGRPPTGRSLVYELETTSLFHRRCIEQVPRELRRPAFMDGLLREIEERRVKASVSCD